MSMPMDYAHRKVLNNTRSVGAHTTGIRYANSRTTKDTHGGGWTSQGNGSLFDTSNDNFMYYTSVAAGYSTITDIIAGYNFGFTLPENASIKGYKIYLTSQIYVYTGVGTVSMKVVSPNIGNRNDLSYALGVSAPNVPDIVRSGSTAFSNSNVVVMEDSTFGRNLTAIDINDPDFAVYMEIEVFNNLDASNIYGILPIIHRLGIEIFYDIPEPEPGEYNTGWVYPNKVFQISDPGTVKQWEEFTAGDASLQPDSNRATRTDDYTTTGLYMASLCASNFGFIIPVSATLVAIDFSFRWAYSSEYSREIRNIASGVGLVDDTDTTLPYPSSAISSYNSAPRDTTSNQPTYYDSVMEIIIDKGYIENITIDDINKANFTAFLKIYCYSFKDYLPIYDIGLRVHYTIEEKLGNLIKMGSF